MEVKNNRSKNACNFSDGQNGHLKAGHKLWRSGFVLLAALLLASCSEQVPPAESFQEMPEKLPKELPEVVEPADEASAVPENMPESDLSVQPEADGPKRNGPLSPRDYTFSYWQQGRRGETDPEQGDILIFETGCYGLTLDMAHLERARFGLLHDEMGYADAVKAETSRLGGLGDALLRLEVEVGGRRYRASQIVMPENEKDLKEARVRLRDVWLWESGRIVQHLELNQVRLKAADGTVLPATARLTITAFPDTLTFAVQINPSAEIASWKGASVELALETEAETWQAEHVINDDGELDKEHLLGISCEVGRRQGSLGDITVSAVHVESGKTLPTAYDPMRGCFVVTPGKLERGWQPGFTEIRNYDEFDIEIDNRGSTHTTVRFLLDGHAAGVTGVVPILCKPDGTPTGIPVQISKNWHKPPRRGNFFRPYTLIPAAPGKQRYKLRCTYGYYGTVPGASHAQLSLVGYGWNGRWAQLAIGCWGETMCFDMDMSLTTSAVTDVRTLFVRNGKDGKKWKFTSGGHGGDWLNATDEQGGKLLFSQMKTAYHTQGPCLTDVEYRGFYGTRQQVRLHAALKTLRTDDFHRTFQDVDYEFQTELKDQEDGWLFKFGNKTWPTRTVVYGNADGKVGEFDFSRGDAGEFAADRLELSGPPPWWIAFPESGEKRTDRDWGQGSRALIIRGYEAAFGGREYEAPSISLPVKKVDDDGWADVHLRLTAPKGVDDFEAGDRVHMRLEWITLPREVDDYYGPNEAFRKHIAKYPRSWKTTYREAKGNDLKIQAAGGTVKNNYPVIVEATRSDNIQVKIEGGVGFVPIRFENLVSPNYALYQVEGRRRKKLDQSVHGNDFWQTDYDAVSDTYSMVFNLPLDHLGVSGWELKAEQ